MADFSSFLQDGDVVLKRLNHKTDSAVLHIRHNDGREAVLRVYPHMVTTYQSLTGHKCEYLPQVYGTYEREGCKQSSKMHTFSPQNTQFFVA